MLHITVFLTIFESEFKFCMLLLWMPLENKLIHVKVKVAIFIVLVYWMDAKYLANYFIHVWCALASTLRCIFV